MEAFNLAIFRLIQASAPVQPWTVALATCLGDGLIGLVPLVLAWGWLRGRPDLRAATVRAGLAAVMALAASALIGTFWPHPRPFMAGLAPDLLGHVPEASFPSDHLTLMWSVAISLMLARCSRRVGLVLALLGLPMAWARIWLGVHFPLDMVGALAVGGSAAWLLQAVFGSPVSWLVGYLQTMRNRILSPLIARGWASR